MIEYPKIESLYNRDERTHKFIPGDWRHPAFEYLKDDRWRWTEKVDGTNIRVMWDGTTLRFGARTDNASIPATLFVRLQELFTPADFAGVWDGPVCLYGEGYAQRFRKTA